MKAVIIRTLSLIGAVVACSAMIAPYGQDAYKPRVSKDQARSIAESFMKMANVEYRGEPIVALCDANSKRQYPRWQLHYSNYAMIDVEAERGWVISLSNSKVDQERLRGRRKGLEGRFTEAEAKEYGFKLLKKLGAPKNSNIAYFTYNKSGEGGPKHAIAVDLTHGGIHLRRHSWMTFDAIDGVMIFYMRPPWDYKVDASEKKFQGDDLKVQAQALYAQHLRKQSKQPPAKLSKVKLSYYPADLADPIQGPCKPLRGTITYRLAWVYYYSLGKSGSESVAMDAETGKPLDVNILRHD